MSMTALFDTLKYGTLDAFWLWMMRRRGTPMRLILIVSFPRFWRKFL